MKERGTVRRLDRLAFLRMAQGDDDDKSDNYDSDRSGSLATSIFEYVLKGMTGV